MTKAEKLIAAMQSALNKGKLTEAMIKSAGGKDYGEWTAGEHVYGFKCNQNFRTAGVFYVLVCWHGQDKGVYEFDPEG